MNSALEALQRADAEGVDIAGTVAAHAVKTAARLVRDTDIGVDVAIFDREGKLRARTPVVSAAITTT